MAVFWVVAPCSLVEVYQRFGGPCCFHHQGDETTGRYNPEDSHLRTHHRENLNSYIITIAALLEADLQRSEVFMVVKTLTVVFSVMMLCRLVGGYTNIWEEAIASNNTTLIPNFVKMNLSKRKRTHTDTWTYAPPAL
jgi:hypothetical protein